MKLLLLAAVMMSGCAALPSAQQIDGAVTCVNVETLTTRTTTVYVSTDYPGTTVVQPDCTVAITR